MRSLVLIAVLSFPAQRAMADSDSTVTLGLGAAFAFDHFRDYDRTSGHAFGVAFDLRLQLFGYVGLEARVAPNQGHVDQSDLVFASQFRLSVLAYFARRDSFGLYLALGWGATDLEDIISFTGRTTNYHFGPGLEVFLGDNFALGLRFEIVVPGIYSMQEAVMENAFEAAIGGEPVENPEISDFIDYRNFRAGVTLRYYL